MARARRSRLLSPTAYARRAGVYRGLFGGDRTWLAIGGVVWGARMLRKTFGRTETIVATEVLKPGQFVTIDTIRPPSRKERKALKASSK